MAGGNIARTKHRGGRADELRGFTSCCSALAVSVVMDTACTESRVHKGGLGQTVEK